MKRVLVVDDDPDLLEMICLMILSNNMSPLCVSSGSQALKAMEDETFDLLLMDIYLGDLDGRDLSRKLKEDLRFRSVPILLYSAGEISAPSIISSMADGFIQKPFNMTVLIQRMRIMMAA